MSGLTMVGSVSYLPDDKGMTQQQKRDVEAVAKSQVLNELHYRRRAATEKSGIAINQRAFEESLVKARDEAGKARSRLKEEGIDAAAMLKQK